MILSYNWVVLDNPLPPNAQLSEHIISAKSSKSQILISPQSPNSSARQTNLSCPLIPFLFSYFIEEPFQTNIIDLQPQIYKGTHRLQLQTIQVRRKNGLIYMLLKIQSSECYQTLLRFLIHIRYQQQINPKIETVEDLVKLMGSRQVNMHSKKTHTSIKKQIYINQPVQTQYRYQNGQCCYVWIKITHSLFNNQKVIIQGVSLMNWLAVGNEKFKEQIINSTWQPNQKVYLEYKQSYSVMFMMKASFPKIQIPFSLFYRIQGIQGYKGFFRMIKYLSLQLC